MMFDRVVCVAVMWCLVVDVVLVLLLSVVLFLGVLYFVLFCFLFSFFGCVVLFYLFTDIVTHEI